MWGEGQIQPAQSWRTLQATSVSSLISRCLSFHEFLWVCLLCICVAKSLAFCLMDKIFAGEDVGAGALDGLHQLSDQEAHLRRARVMSARVECKRVSIHRRPRPPTVPAPAPDSVHRIASPEGSQVLDEC